MANNKLPMPIEDQVLESRGATRALVTAGIVAGATLAPIAAGIAYSRLAVEHAAPLPFAIEADRRGFRSPMAGQMSYYAETSGEGRPLVLIHSINAAASAYEMRPLFDYFRGRRPVYAMDLPGFGFSERGDRIYSAELFTTALLDLLHEVNAQEHGGADIVALSLGSEFAARAARHQPEMVHSLALISPTGLSGRTSSRMGGQGLRNVFGFPLWSQAFYDALVSRTSLRYYLQRSFEGEIDPGLLDYAWATSHQPGARFAPLYFISGLLFTPDAVELLYERVTQPALVLYDRDGFITFDALPTLLAQRSNWQAERITPTLGLPQFERLGDTTRALQSFWAKTPVTLR
jgi:pimeloyl-ACP methyl ester carboxylesterase